MNKGFLFGLLAVLLLVSLLFLLVANEDRSGTSARSSDLALTTETEEADDSEELLSEGVSTRDSGRQRLAAEGPGPEVGATFGEAWEVSIEFLGPAPEPTPSVRLVDADGGLRSTWKEKAGPSGGFPMEDEPLEAWEIVAAGYKSFSLSEARELGLLRVSPAGVRSLRLVPDWAYVAQALDATGRPLAGVHVVPTEAPNLARWRLDWVRATDELGTAIILERRVAGSAVVHEDWYAAVAPLPGQAPGDEPFERKRCSRAKFIEVDLRCPPGIDISMGEGEQLIESLTASLLGMTHSGFEQAGVTIWHLPGDQSELVRLPSKLTEFVFESRGHEPLTGGYSGLVRNRVGVWGGPKRPDELEGRPIRVNAIVPGCEVQKLKIAPEWESRGLQFEVIEMQPEGAAPGNLFIDWEFPDEFDEAILLSNRLSLHFEVERSAGQGYLTSFVEHYKKGCSTIKGIPPGSYVVHYRMLLDDVDRIDLTSNPIQIRPGETTVVHARTDNRAFWILQWPDVRDSGFSTWPWYSIHRDGQDDGREWSRDLSFQYSRAAIIESGQLILTRPGAEREVEMKVPQSQFAEIEFALEPRAPDSTRFSSGPLEPNAVLWTRLRNRVPVEGQAE